MTAESPSASLDPQHSATLAGAGNRNSALWLGEQECFSWGVTAWAAVAAAVAVGWPVRVLTRNRAPRSA